MSRKDDRFRKVRQELDIYLEVLKRDSQSRKDRVEALREEVTRGAYRVDTEKVAAKLIESYFEDISHLLHP